jgi:cytochrome c6
MAAVLPGSAETAAGVGASAGLRPRWWLRLLVLVALLLLVLWPRPAWGLSEMARGARLFEQHCAGCHVNGGNILRRGKTLKLAALERYGRADPAVIATIAAAGVGQMGGYAAVLGDGGPEAVASWVWQQATAGWPRG